MSFTVCSACSDCQDIGNSQFCFVAPFALIVCPMQESVTLIFARSAPLEIRHMVVCWISVQMSTLQSIRTRTNKRSEHQSVYEHYPLFPIVKKSDSVITAISYCWLDTLGITPTDGSTSVAANRNDISRLIDSVMRIVWNYTKTRGNARIEIRHARFLQN